MTSAGVRSSSRVGQALRDSRSCLAAPLCAEPAWRGDLLGDSPERMSTVATRLAGSAALTSPPAVPRIHSDS
jgi:hypothetical protein